MKTKIFSIFMAFFLPLSVFTVKADEPIRVEIPLEKVSTDVRDNRSMNLCSIECYYVSLSESFITTVSANLGIVDIEITNLSTGEAWYDIFDSATEPQTVLPISGTPGLYEIVYTTQSGDIYEGTLIIE